MSDSVPSHSMGYDTPHLDAHTGLNEWEDLVDGTEWGIPNYWFVRVRYSL